MKQTGADRAQVMPNCTVKKSTAESSFFVRGRSKCGSFFGPHFWSFFGHHFWDPWLR